MSHRNISYLSVGQIISVEEQSDPIILEPICDNAVVELEAPLLDSVSFIIGNINNCAFGNRLTFAIKVDPGNSTGTLIFDPIFFYMTMCGNVSPDSNIINIGGLERWVITFFFDGEKYVNTMDNC